MTTSAKRLLFAGSGALLLGLVLLCFVNSGGPRYRAESRVVVRPYTNAVFTRSFEAHIIQAIPGVLRLWVTPGFSAIPTPGAVATTNSAAIHVIAVGATAEDAQRAANEAANRLCRMVSEEYSVTAIVADPAHAVRRYSFFHDRLQPAITRLFKP